MLHDRVSVNINVTWVTYISNVLSNKTILFYILDFWCQLVVIRFVKRLSKRRMFVSSMKISACWLLHRLIKFNKICWENRPAKTRPNLRTSFCRRDLKNTKPHLKGGSEPLEKQSLESSPPLWILWTEILFKNLQIFHNFAQLGKFRGEANDENGKKNRNRRKSRENSRNLSEAFQRSRTEENFNGHCDMNSARRIFSKGSTLLRVCWFWSKKLHF